MEKPFKKGLSRLPDGFVDHCDDLHGKRFKIRVTFTWPKFMGQDISNSKNLQVKELKAYEGGGTLEFHAPHALR